MKNIATTTQPLTHKTWADAIASCGAADTLHKRPSSTCKGIFTSL
ncbi:hypothetical protein [Nodularia sp. UHCC 0506]|nr:hypothetical protein [Nodularia sp. UHCC 0506]MEA5512443.1 hypothetical protein [Nodularia sp. UHCC 0506]